MADRATWVGVAGLALYPRVPLIPGITEATAPDYVVRDDFLGPLVVEPTLTDLAARASPGVACYGVASGGRPYYDPQGASPGEQALIKLDEVTGRPYVQVLP